MEDKAPMIAERSFIEDAEHHRLVLYLFAAMAFSTSNRVHGGNFMEDRIDFDAD